MRSDGRIVGAHTTATASRLIALVAGVLLVSATIGVAAESNTAPQSKPAVTPKQRVLVVPDVRRQVFVFAKGTLEDSGFGWVVTGSTRGYAANSVVSQSPSPGTRVVDTGAPKITLTLEHNPRYQQAGTPEDVSPYGASLIRPTAAAVAHAKAVAAKKAAAKKAAARAHKAHAKSAEAQAKSSKA